MKTKTTRNKGLRSNDPSRIIEESKVFLREDEIEILKQMRTMHSTGLGV